MKLLDIVHQVAELTGSSPYAVIGGLAQILWARKTHTDDLDIALASENLAAALEAVRQRTVVDWTEPARHLLCRGSVVDLIAFRDAAFNGEIIRTAKEVTELGNVPFIRPELLLVTHLLRPGPQAALAAVELVIARKHMGGMDLNESRRWAAQLGYAERLDHVFAQAQAMELV